MRMPPNVFDDDDDDSPVNEDPVTLTTDENYGARLIHNRERDDLQRFEKAKKEGEIVSDDDESESEDELPEPDDDESDIGEFIDALVKVKTGDPVFRVTGLSDRVVDEEERKKRKEEKKKKQQKKKKMYLKDVQARQLIEGGPDSLEENDERRGIQTYTEQNEELKRAVRDAMEAGEGNDDDEDLFRVKEGGEVEVEEEDEELKKKADEYFGEESQLDEGSKFLRDFLLKQMWKEKDEESIDVKKELDKLDRDEEAVWDQEEYELSFRHEENAGETVMGQSRIVEGSVRKTDNSRKAQRKKKEDRMKAAEMERQEELKRLKNVKKKEMREKMKKVLSVAGFKEGEECPLDARDLDDEFDPEEYDKMMKAAFDEDYYGAEDDDLRSDEDDDGNEKPDFDKEDELLGLPKNWDVIQGGDGFTAAREKVLKQKENVAGDEDEVEEEVDEEEEREGKRKRKKKTSLVQRAKEALMEEYYKLDYEDTIGDLKTRFKFAKVQPNSYGLEPEEILFLDDTELNQYVPLKKMAPYVEKDWEVNRHKVKEQKLKVSELWQRIDDNHDEKKRSKKRKKKDVEEKKKKPEEKAAADEEGEAETSKLSRKAKRRRRAAEKKLPPNRMVAYGKTN